MTGQVGWGNHRLSERKHSRWRQRSNNEERRPRAAVTNIFV